VRGREKPKRILRERYKGRYDEGPHGGTGLTIRVIWDEGFGRGYEKKFKKNELRRKFW
jgi:hypothetical protein